MYRPGLLLPGGLSRPAGKRFQPNACHPFMRANPKLLAVCHGGRAMYDYISRAPSSITGTTTPRLSPRIGWGVDCSGAAGFAEWADPVNSSNPVVTMFAVCVFDTAAANRDLITDTGGLNAGRRFRYNSATTSMELLNGGVGSGNINSGFAPTTGIPYFMAVSANKFTGQAVFVFRELLTGKLTVATATNTTTPTTGDNNYRIGAGPTVFDGAIAMGGIAAGWLPLRALVDWSADPWGVFEPATIAIGSQDITASVIGDLSATLGALTLSSAGTVAIAGSSAVTLANVTLASAGTVSIVGVLAATLANVTLSSAGAVSVTGAVAVTLGAVTLSSAGAVAVAGALGSTLSPVTLIATGAVAVTGALAVTLGTLLLSSINSSTTVRWVKRRLGIGISMHGN